MATTFILRMTQDLEVEALNGAPGISLCWYAGWKRCCWHGYETIASHSINPIEMPNSNGSTSILMETTPIYRNSKATLIQSRKRRFGTTILSTNMTYQQTFAELSSVIRSDQGKAKQTTHQVLKTRSKLSNWMKNRRSQRCLFLQPALNLKLKSNFLIIINSKIAKLKCISLSQLY
jgi:hypothetical protein